jgi:hypothetical protein
VHFFSSSNRHRWLDAIALGIFAVLIVLVVAMLVANP